MYDIYKSAGVAVQELDSKIGQPITLSAPQIGGNDGGGAYGGTFYGVAANFNIPANAIGRAHYVNCSIASNITLPNARRGGWVKCCARSSNKIIWRSGRTGTRSLRSGCRWRWIRAPRPMSAKTARCRSARISRARCGAPVRPRW